MALILIIIIIIDYYKDVFAHEFYYHVYDFNATSTFCFHVLKIQMRMRNSIPGGSINQYTYENGVQFEIKSLQSSRLSSFTVPEDTCIISVIVDQNFTMNAIGMVLDSL